MVGYKLSLADVFCACLLVPAFQTVLDEGFRKAMPNMTKWWTACMSNPAFIARMGTIEPISTAMKAFDPNPVDEAPAKPKGGKKGKQGGKKKDDKPIDVDELELDLFGGDDDGEAAKKAAKDAKGQKKKKEKPKDMSMVMLEVKPLDDTTDLDLLAKRIFKDIKQQGLFWKTEFKKEPVAFGIFKLIIGFSCVDDETSVDKV